MISSSASAAPGAPVDVISDWTALISQRKAEEQDKINKAEEKNRAVLGANASRSIISGSYKYNYKGLLDLYAEATSGYV